MASTKQDRIGEWFLSKQAERRAAASFINW